VKPMAAPSNNLALTRMFAICPNLKKIPTFLILSSDLYSSRIEIYVIVQSIGSSPDINTLGGDFLTVILRKCKKKQFRLQSIYTQKPKPCHYRTLSLHPLIPPRDPLQPSKSKRTHHAARHKTHQRQHKTPKTPPPNSAQKSYPGSVSTPALGSKPHDRKLYE
jgi:hypothetical protein